MNNDVDDNGDWLPLTIEEQEARERRERRVLGVWLAIVAAGALLIAATLGAIWGTVAGRLLR